MTRTVKIGEAEVELIGPGDREILTVLAFYGAMRLGPPLLVWLAWRWLRHA